MSTASDVRTLLHFLQDVYVDRVGQPRAAVANALQMARSVQLPTGARPASPITPLTPANLPAINTLAQREIHNSSPATAGGGAENVASTQLDSGISIEPERPRFVPADYIKYHRPWEEQMRKTQLPNAAMEIKVREMDETSLARNATPSVKARKFGRSMVNLLRTKHSQDGSGRPPLPSSPHPPTAEAMQAPSNWSERSERRRSLEKAQFKSNVESLGM
ncbi:hypothetical protein LTR37_016266 [Vermiconidia calcicola]|uniref:Uncharacterized protein n=1 Tax=Vermiconidia calcicola TaxID=1690605 RepID=A0ACC3MP43_9PEZI|nr:hypothetical protein LTR37_016266 [Vermiconidia calcicola]